MPLLSTPLCKLLPAPVKHFTSPFLLAPSTTMWSFYGAERVKSHLAHRKSRAREICHSVFLCSACSLSIAGKRQNVVVVVVAVTIIQ